MKKFLIKYRSEKNQNEPVSPSTMKGYLSVLKRFFKEEWGYDLPIGDEKHKIFGNIDGGLWTALDNRTREHQANGMVRKHYNLLSVTNVRKLFESPELSGDIPRSFQCRLIIGVALLTAMRPKQLSSLEVSQITRCAVEGKSLS